MATRKSYAEQIKHPNWQRKRLEVLQSAEFECELCGEKEKTLHVHHKRYVKGREVWEYTRQELQCLCELCHAEHHELHGLLEEVLANADHFDPYRTALGLIAGYLDACYSLDTALSDRVREKVGRSMDFGALAMALAVAGRDRLLACLELLVADKCEEIDPALSLTLQRLRNPGGEKDAPE